jgi:hypothetical protein
MHKLIVLLIAVPCWILFSSGSAAAQTDHVTMSASVGGRDISSANADYPITLQPGQPVDVAVKFINSSTEPVTVHRIVLRGTVLGLTLFTYDSYVDFTVPPASNSTLSYRLDLAELGTQATGLIHADLSAIDTAGQPIAKVGTVTDVRGSLTSVYGSFGIALVVLTALSLLDVALAVHRRTLPNNRWRRGLRLLAPGIGLGLIMAFSTSVLRVWVPTTERWLLIAGITSAVFFTLGYFASATHDVDDADVVERCHDTEPDPPLVADLQLVATQGVLR